jgi:hypothetical protein
MNLSLLNAAETLIVASDIPKAKASHVADTLPDAGLHPIRLTANNTDYTNPARQISLFELHIAPVRCKDV